MLKLKVAIIVFTCGFMCSAKVKEFIKAVGAQAMNPNLMGDETRLEPGTLVFGHVPKHLEGKYELFVPYEGLQVPEELILKGKTSKSKQADLGLTGETSGVDSGSSDDLIDQTDGDSGDEVTEEITIDEAYLAGMDKTTLLEFAQENGIGLTTTDKKSAPKIRKAILNHFVL